MKSWTDPTPDDVLKVQALLQHEQHRRQFFMGLENPMWILPLRDRGMFSKPPAPVRHEEEGTVRFPPWPESKYLARMATHKPEIVTEILSSIAETDNVMIHEDCVDAALNMPPELCAWVTGLLDEWLGGRPHFQLSGKLAKLICKLADSGRGVEALTMASKALAVLPGNRQTNEQFRRHLWAQPQLRFQYFEYEEMILTCVPRLTAVAPAGTLRLMCDLLDDATTYSERIQYRNDREDGSYVWCPSVAACGMGRHRDLRSLLVGAVRYAAMNWVSSNAKYVRDVIELYDSRRCRIFERLGYELLARFPEEAIDIVKTRLTDRDRFDVFSTQHEYELLTEACFAMLPREEQAQMLSWIDDGPNLSQFAESVEQVQGERPPDRELQQYADRWRRDRLAPIAAALPAEWSSRYTRLVEAFGEPDRQPFQAVSVGAAAPSRSPVTVDELGTKATEEIVRFLKGWREKDRFQEPSFEGLVQTLRTLVSTEPDRFIHSWEAFKTVPPRYFYGLLAGFGDTLRTRWRDDWWPPALAAAEWATAQPGALTEEEPESDDRRESSWAWAPAVVADFLQTGLTPGEHAISLDQRSIVWKILQRLTSHPDPSPEAEREDQGRSNMDYLTMSLNCVRGKAFHSVVKYALWLRHNWTEKNESQELVARGLNAMPEVRDTLAEHLELSRDASLAVRAVYGQWFPWLLLVDKRWATENAPRIFSQDPEQFCFWDAAWSSYVTYCAPYNDVCRVLRPCYRRAIANLADGEVEEDPVRDPQRRLAEHLMVYLGQGVIDSNDELITEFFSTAPASIRGRAIEFVGWGLAKEQDAVSADVLDRFRALWEMRLAAATGSDDKPRCDRELMAFGWWFASGRFDPRWALTQLCVVLQLCGWAEPDSKVVHELRTVAHVNLEVAIDCITSLIDGDPDGWAIGRWGEDLRALLSAARQSPIPSVLEKTRRVVNRLGERGFFEFRDLA